MCRKAVLPHARLRRELRALQRGIRPPKEEPLDPELGGSHRRLGGTFVPTVEATDSWIWREWLDIEPGGEAVDVGDLAGEFGSGAGRDMWLSRAEMEAG